MTIDVLSFLVAMLPIATLLPAAVLRPGKSPILMMRPGRRAARTGKPPLDLAA